VSLEALILRCSPAWASQRKSTLSICGLEVVDFGLPEIDQDEGGHSEHAAVLRDAAFGRSSEAVNLSISTAF
jgi:hypothetical protein